MSANFNGKFISAKHASIGLGLHSITGMKIPITIMERLRHSIMYDQVNQIETAQAELVQCFQSLNLNLPSQLTSDYFKVGIGTVSDFFVIDYIVTHVYTLI